MSTMNAEQDKMDVTGINYYQAELYESIVNNEDNCMELVKKYEDIVRKEIEIKVGSLCQCGQDFEKVLIQEMDQTKIVFENMSQMIRHGICVCGPVHRINGTVVKLTFAHVAAMANNTELLRLLASDADLLKQQTSLVKLSPIFIAVTLKNEEATDFLLTQDIDINAACTADHSITLMCAVKQKNIKLVERILQIPGVKINMKTIRGECPITLSLHMQCKEIFDMLIDAGADVNATFGMSENSLLMIAVTKGMGYVTKLLENGVNVNFTNSRNESALHFAVYVDNAKIVKVLMDANANPDLQVLGDQMTPIVIAAGQGETAVVEVLARNGADVNISSTQGYNAVHMAAWNGYTAMLKVLLEAEGVEYDRLTSDKNTPLGLACHGNHQKAVELLLPMGCNVNNQDKDNDTALLYATYNGMTDTVRLLLEHGADPDLRNKSNVSPLWNAIYGKHTEIVKILLGVNVIMEVNSIGTNQHSNTNAVIPLFDSPRSTLYVAVRHECSDIIYLLVSAGYNVNGEQWLLSGDCSEFEKQRNIISKLMKQASQPPRLISICRNFFRRYGNPLKIKELVHALDLPRFLENYLLLTDLLTKS